MAGEYEAAVPADEGPEMKLPVFNPASQEFLERVAWRLPQAIALLVSTCDGIPLLTAINPGYEMATQHAETKLAATFATCTDQAAKLRFGSLKLLLTSFEGLRVIHINGGNLVITLLAETDANIGVMVDAAPQLVKALRAVNHEVAHTRNEES